MLLTSAVLLAAIAPGSSASGPSDLDPAADRPPAYHLERGSVAHRRIVALGRDLVVEGDAESHAVVLSGSIRISGRVRGDVTVISGAARLEPTAEVGGHVYVLGGTIVAAPGAVIGGQSVAYPDAASVWLSLFEAPSMGLPAWSPVVLGANLALLAFWSLMVLLLFTVGRRELLSTSQSVQVEPFRNFTLGLVGISAMVLTTLFFSAFTGAIIGVPLLVLLAVVALVLRFWGLVAVFHALGAWVFRALKKRPPLPLAAACYGLVVLGVLKFFPWVGSWTWMIATFIGVGAALSTKFGRREAWFEA